MQMTQAKHQPETNSSERYHLETEVRKAVQSETPFIETVLRESLDQHDDVRKRILDSGLVDALAAKVESSLWMRPELHETRKSPSHKVHANHSEELGAALPPTTPYDNQARPTAASMPEETPWTVHSNESRVPPARDTPLATNNASTARSRISRFDPRTLYLKVSIARGFAFLGNGRSDLAEDVRSSMQLHLLFRDRRYESAMVMSAVEPVFEFQRLIPLPSADTQVLLHCTDKLHIVVSQTHHPSGQIHLLGTLEVDVREALCSLGAQGIPQRPRKRHFEVKEVGEDVIVGALEVVLDCVPKDAAYIPISSDEVDFQLRREQRKYDEVHRFFYAHAKQWYNDYLQIRPSHSQRLVKLFAYDERGTKLPVTNFLSPLRSRTIETPRHAVRFVSLLDVDTVPRGVTAEDVWLHPHTAVTVSRASVASLAVLLASLLLGFHVDAYVALGTGSVDETGSAHGRGNVTAWVVVVLTGGVVEFVCPSTGTRHPARSGVGKKDVPWRTCGCMWNHEGFWANVGGTDFVADTVFDVADARYWKPLGREVVLSMKRPAVNLPLVPFRFPQRKSPGSGEDLHYESMLPSSYCETELEAVLKSQISMFRDDHDLLTAWDDELSHLLGQCLWSCEMAKLAKGGHHAVLAGDTVLGGGVSSVEFQEGVRRAIPQGHTFKGFPVHFNTMNPQRIFNTFVTTKSCRNLLLTRGDKVRFGVRVRMFGYGERCLACWVMLSVRSKSYDE